MEKKEVENNASKRK